MCDWRSLLATDPGFILRLDAGPARPLGGRLFRKEVARVGRWVHPTSGRLVVLSASDLEEIAQSTNAYILALGGRLRFPNRHDGRFITGKEPNAEDNLGYWLSFGVEDGKLYGVCEAGDDEVAKMLGGRIRGVSLCLVSEARDSHGNRFTNVLDHVAATPEPVIDGQENFIPLSRGGASEAARVPVLTPASEEQPNMKQLISYLALSADATEDQVLAEVKKREAATKQPPSAAPATAGQDVVALAARAATLESANTALSQKVAALEAQALARDQAECDAAVKEVKALAAGAGKPEAFGAEREKRVRDLWPKDRETAREILALSREAIGAPAPGVAGAKPAKPPAGLASEAEGKKEAVKQVVAMLSAGGVDAEISTDGLSYRAKGSASWQTL